MYTNRVQLIGYVAKDLATSTAGNGNKRIAIRMATHYSTKNEYGENLFHSVWHDVVAWNGTAEFAAKKFCKGQQDYSRRRYHVPHLSRSYRAYQVCH